VGQQVQAWPGTPVALVCPDPGMRARLRRQRLREHVMIRATLKGALSSLDRMAAATIAHRPLAANITSARAARDFVSRTCLDWGLRHVTAPACLVVSELVTNAMLHASGEITVSVARHGTNLRLAVRDHGTGLPRIREPDFDSVNGRGMALVAGFSRTWGVLPAADGGKVVWAVFGL
jgi:anti-sigma regulatory factor (Ser/Thr protein kinase)